MGKKIQQFIILGVIGYIVYFLLSHHIILFGNEFEILNKSELNFTHTFYSVNSAKEIRYKGLDSLLADDDLREAGLMDLLLERELITEEQLEQAEKKLAERE